MGFFYERSDARVKKAIKIKLVMSLLQIRPLREFVFFKIKTFFILNFIPTYSFTVHYSLNDQVLTVIKKEEGYFWSGSAFVLHLCFYAVYLRTNFYKSSDLQFYSNAFSPSTYRAVELRAV